MNSSEYPATMNQASSKSEEANDLVWEAITREAQESYLSRRPEEASNLWTRAGKLTGEFSKDDPRHCAALNNSGLVRFLERLPEQSETAFRTALEDWQRARTWTASMAVSGTARSSMFHHRLETRHRDAFNDYNRVRYRGWIDGGEAITAFNLSIVLICLDRKSEALDQMSHAINLRERAFGACNPELAGILKTTAVFSHDDEISASYLKRAAKAEETPSRNSLERWHSERPQVMNDLRRLLGAICLTAMISEHDVFNDHAR